MGKVRSLFIFLMIIPLIGNAGKFPSEDELDGIIKGCGIGISKKVQAGVSVKIKSWRDAAIKGDASYSELGAILNESPNGVISPDNYKIYTGCVQNLVKEFNSVSQTADQCKNPIFKVGRGPACGVELYKNSASPACGVLENHTRSESVCGVDQYHRCESGACGWNPCGFIKKCDAKECRNSNCGVERYKSCQHASFGVKSYKTCRNKNHQIEIYKSCRNEEFGFDRCST